jgi:hypothetical protein
MRKMLPTGPAVWYYSSTDFMTNCQWRRGDVQTPILVPLTANLVLARLRDHPIP